MVSAGAVGLVLKRTAATELLPAVQAVLAGRSYVSSQGYEVCFSGFVADAELTSP